MAGFAEKDATTIRALFRRYVTTYINAHDFSVLPDIMADDYTLHTSGHVITGRDGPYRAAVAKQLDQFPGLMFTPHELLWSGDRLAVRFTEHGASTKHDGAMAAWPSIAIYTACDGRLATCAIEQDYFSRRRQLDTRTPVAVDRPAVAPWDTIDQMPDPISERRVAAWLTSGDFLSDRAVQIDDARATGETERLIDTTAIDITAMMSGGGKVAFHARQTGLFTGGLGGELAAAIGQPTYLHLSGIVDVDGEAIVRGNLIRDRWGLYRRLQA